MTPDGVEFRGCKLLIATTSQAKAAEAADVSVNEIRTYWSITGNEAQVRLANQHPEKLILIEDGFTTVPVVIGIVDNIKDTNEWRKRAGKDDFS